ELRDETIYQNTEPLAKRPHPLRAGRRFAPCFGLSPALLSRTQEPADHASGFALHHGQSWERGREAQFRRVAGLNACDQRIGENVGGLFPSPASDELGNGFICRHLRRSLPPRLGEELPLATDGKER